jgi:hypothetical protein
MNNLLTLSQSHFRVWDTCARQFQYMFLAKVVVPLPIDPQNSLELGSQFHLLVQQKGLGLEVQAMADSNPKLGQWLNAFGDFAPTKNFLESASGDRFSQNPTKLLPSLYLSEHRRTLAIPPDLAYQNPNQSPNQEASQAIEFAIAAVFDLLILEDRQAQILDWKTHQRTVAAEILGDHWQTRLYLYILTETGHYQPEQISMTYWFANTEATVVIPYGAALHQRTYQDILVRVAEISQALSVQSFPRLAIGSPICERCNFYEYCWGGNQVTEMATYPEVEI